MPIVINGSGTVTGITGITGTNATVTGITSVSSNAANTAVLMQDSSSNSATCRAWVNFNGTGTVAIRASFNVSSITDGGTGDYTVNFTTAMPDANYAVSLTISAPSSASVPAAGVSTSTAPTTSNFRMTVNQSGVGQQDPVYTNVAVFR